VYNVIKKVLVKQHVIIRTKLDIL